METMARERVLIVDDDPNVRRVIREVLLRSNYEPVEAVDATEGLAKAADLRPAVILLEVWMGGVDGYAVCRQLKANAITRHIPVVFVTGFVPGEEDAEFRCAHEAGAVAYITKPFHLETLAAVIAAAIADTEPLG
jgi:putative two-component system response regulator